MSFTFRNLFSEEGEYSAPETPQEAEATSPDDIFSSPSTGGVLKDSPSEGYRETAFERTQSFLVSELLPFIPPAISAKSGIPMEDELILRMPADGSTDVKLSVIYQVCPQLFAAEITPLNDSTVTLPAKLELSAGGEEKSAVRLSGVAFGANPFSVDEETAAADTTEAKTPEAGADGKVEEDNPSWSPESLGAEAALEGKKFDEPASNFSGFEALAVTKPEPLVEEARQDFDNLKGFTAPAVDLAEEEPKAGVIEDHAPADGLEEPAASASEEVESEAFGGNGFDNSGGGFSTLFCEQAEGDSEIPFPGSCKETVPAEGHGTWGTMFKAGFSGVNGGEDIAPVPDGFGDRLPREIKGEAEPGQNAPASSLESIEAEMVAPPAAEVFIEEPMPEKNKPDTFGLDAAPAFSESKSYDQGMPGGFDAPVNAAPEEDAAPDSEPATLPPAVSTAATFDFAVGLVDEAEEMPDLEMRAIFSSSDSFTLSRVARKIVELPDMMGCALATPVRLVQASRSEESRLGDESQETIQSVKNLAKLTGLPDTKSFTLQSDRGIVSLFMEGSCCLIVRHNAPEFGPGIREKLILIARTMHKLND